MRVRWPRSTVVVRALVVSLLAVVGAEIWRALAALHRASITTSYMHRPRPGLAAQLPAADSAVHNSAVATFVCLLIAGVFFVAWRYESARVAMRGFDPVGARLRWPIGGWFVPLLDVVGPRWLVDYFWRRAAWRNERRAPTYVYVWWCAFFVSAFVERFFPTGATKTLGDVVLLDHRRALAALLEAVVAVCAIGVVRMLTRRALLNRNSDTPAYPAATVAESLPGYVR